MRTIKLQDDIYKKAQKISKSQGLKVNDLISEAIAQGLEAVSEQKVLDLYKLHKITLQKAAAMLSVDLWEMIEKIKRADIHIDYSMEELAEDLK